MVQELGGLCLVRNLVEFVYRNYNLPAISSNCAYNIAQLSDNVYLIERYTSECCSRSGAETYGLPRQTYRRTSRISLSVLRARSQFCGKFDRLVPHLDATSRTSRARKTE